eukprot:8833946-Ditylum_brightwellii.AAC.1
MASVIQSHDEMKPKLAHGCIVMSITKVKEGGKYVHCLFKLRLLKRPVCLCCLPQLHHLFFYYNRDEIIVFI